MVYVFPGYGIQICWAHVVPCPMRIDFITDDVSTDPPEPIVRPAVAFGEELHQRGIDHHAFFIRQIHRKMAEFRISNIGIRMDKRIVFSSGHAQRY